MVIHEDLEEVRVGAPPTFRDSGPSGGMGSGEVETQVAEDAHSGDKEGSDAPSETGAVNEISSEDDGKGWVTPRILMDSGAAQSVAPPSMAPGVVIEASPGSQRGQHYVSASGGSLPNMGQQKMKVQTNEGRDALVLYQIAEVSRPSTAVSQTCGNGNWVVYTPEEVLFGTSRLVG